MLAEPSIEWMHYSTVASAGMLGMKLSTASGLLTSRCVIILHVDGCIRASCCQCACGVGEKEPQQYSGLVREARQFAARWLYIVAGGLAGAMSLETNA
jgi:hypothetical protein